MFMFMFRLLQKWICIFLDMLATVVIVAIIAIIAIVAIGTSLGKPRSSVDVDWGGAGNYSSFTPCEQHLNSSVDCNGSCRRTR